MDWLKETFYLKPIPTALLVVAGYVSAIIYRAPGAAKKAEEAVAENGLKPISLSQFGRYLNRTSCTCLQSMFDGSRFNAPVIENVLTGKYEDFTVTIFSFGLPTGRTGTWQTVIHLRPELPRWLPIFSVIDEVTGKKMSDILKCEHAHNIPLVNPNFINRHLEAHKIRAFLARKPVLDTSIAAIKSPLQGIVVDSTGEDLFLYRHGESIDPAELEAFIERGTKFWRMIDSGNIDATIFKDSVSQRITKLNLVAQAVLVVTPGIVTITAVGYGKPLTAACFLAISGIAMMLAKLRASQLSRTLNSARPA